MPRRFYPAYEVHIIDQRYRQVLDELQEGAVFYLLLKEDLNNSPTYSTPIVLRHAKGITFDLRYLLDIAQITQEVPKDFKSLHIMLTRIFEGQYQGAIDQKGQFVDL